MSLKVRLLIQTPIWRGSFTLERKRALSSFSAILTNFIRGISKHITWGRKKTHYNLLDNSDLMSSKTMLNCEQSNLKKMFSSFKNVLKYTWINVAKMWKNGINVTSFPAKSSTRNLSYLLKFEPRFAIKKFLNL